MQQIQQIKASRDGPERYLVVLALLVPLAMMSVALAQLPGLDSPSAGSGDSKPLNTQRPAASEPAPPPTLVPLPTPARVAPTPLPPPPQTYTVQKGDELKNIAAQYRVSIFELIDTNSLKDPDNLRVGQVLTIPDN